MINILRSNQVNLKITKPFTKQSITEPQALQYLNWQRKELSASFASLVQFGATHSNCDKT